MRVWISIRYEQMKRLAPAIGFILQSATLASILYSLLAWRFEWGLWLFPVLFLSIIGLGFSASWFYYDILKMKEPEQEARYSMEPQYTYNLSPQTAWMIDRLARGMEGDKEAIGEMREAAKNGRIETLVDKSVQQSLYERDAYGVLPKRQEPEQCKPQKPETIIDSGANKSSGGKRKPLGISESGMKPE